MSASGTSARERKKEEEKRKAREAGTAQPEVDVNSGKMINPHNPEFLTKRPWYLGDSGPSMEHHGVRGDTAAPTVSLAEAEADAARRRSAWAAQTAGGGSAVVAVGAWIEALYRGKSPYLPAKVTSVRLDGSLDLEFENGKKGSRVPRKHCKLPKAAAGGRAGLEALGKVAYDAKRDRWHGYDAAAVHADTMTRYAAVDAERQRKKEARTDARAARRRANPDSSNKSDSDSDSDDDSADDEDDEFRQGDANAKDFQKRIARQGGVGGAQMKTTVRNLRIREDTAKYLRNLDPESAFYDPKSRAMRENPTPHLGDPKDLVYAGDNFARATGDALELAKTSCFAWDVERKGKAVGGDVVHVQADPSRLELERRKFEKDKASLAEETRKAVLDKYGAPETEDPDERALRSHAAASETYREFGADGRVVRGAPVAARPSKYAEDVHESGHVAVWGSYFCASSFRWGYADDHSCTRHSYPTGAAAARAAAAISQPPLAALTAPKEGAAAARTKAPPKRADLYGEADGSAELDEAKVKEAVARAKKGGGDVDDDKKRKYNSFQTTEVTPEEMEAYRRTKASKDDPMAKFLSGGGGV